MYMYTCNGSTFILILYMHISLYGLPKIHVAFVKEHMQTICLYKLTDSVIKVEYLLLINNR